MGVDDKGEQVSTWLRLHKLFVTIPATEGKGFRGRCDVIVGRS